MRTLKLLLAVLLMLSLTGCFRRYSVDRQDMYLAPTLSSLPSKVTVVGFYLDRVLDLAEGGQGRFSWTANLLKGDTEERFLALNLGDVNQECRKIALTVIPKPLKEIEGSTLGLINHAGTKIYNQRGEVRELNSIWRKMKLKDYENFLPAINAKQPFVREVATNSEEFIDLTRLYQAHRINDIKLAREYVYKKYGSNLTDEQLEKIAEEDSIVHGFIDWLGRDWKIFITFPFGGIEGTAIVAGIVKVFTLPSIWGDKINKPGYAEYIMTAEDSAEMVLRGISDYGPCFIPKP